MPHSIGDLKRGPNLENYPYGISLLRAEALSLLAEGHGPIQKASAKSRSERKTGLVIGKGIDARIPFLRLPKSYPFSSPSTGPS